jgi:hypothetical protein
MLRLRSISIMQAERDDDDLRSTSFFKTGGILPLLTQRRTHFASLEIAGSRVRLFLFIFSNVDKLLVVTKQDYRLHICLYMSVLHALATCCGLSSVAEKASDIQEGCQVSSSSWTSRDPSTLSLSAPAFAAG